MKIKVTISGDFSCCFSWFVGIRRATRIGQSQVLDSELIGVSVVYCGNHGVILHASHDFIAVSSRLRSGLSRSLVPAQVSSPSLQVSGQHSCSDCVLGPSTGLYFCVLSYPVLLSVVLFCRLNVTDRPVTARCPPRLFPAYVSSRSHNH